jgi:hypothetical protein
MIRKTFYPFRGFAQAQMKITYDNLVAQGRLNPDPNQLKIVNQLNDF